MQLELIKMWLSNKNNAGVISFIFFILFFSFSSYSQKTIKGKILDAETGEGLPFVNVYFKGTTQGTTTNFDGYYSISLSSFPSDSLVASYISYAKKAKYIDPSKESQEVNFQLAPDATMLDAVQVVYGKKYENPAWGILRKVVENKSKNDKRTLESYEYESYSKVELDVDNISEKFRKKKLVQKVIALADSIEKIAGEDGQPILPVFMSESISKVITENNPNRKREDIIKTKITGIGVQDGSIVSQLMGSSFQEYNFYQNWMNLATKDFVSPISDSWKAFYDYELKDEKEIVNGIKCYRITYKPKQEQDLAFKGTIWVAHESYALKQIDATIGKSANLNFIEKVKIQQELEPVDGSNAWLPSKTRVILDVGQIKDDWAGMLAKFYVSNNKFVVNREYSSKLFEQNIVVAEDALINNGEDYWEGHRHDPLTSTEKNVYQMIDGVKKLPIVKTYVEVVNILVNGYKRVGKFDIGPYAYTYANNDFEGHRFRLGFKTNERFSKKLILDGYLAYGTNDDDFKYNAAASFILGRKNYSILGVSKSEELEQIGIYNEDVENTSLFNAAARFGDIRRPFKNEISKVWLTTDLRPGIQQTVQFKNRRFSPRFLFEYFHPENQEIRRSDFTISEASIEYRFAPGETFIWAENSRLSLGTNKPIITLKYTYGIDGFMNSDFSYQKFFGSISHSFRLGGLGRTTYQIQGGYIPSKVPYPLLETHLGNESVFYNQNSFNLMNYFEFASDQYASLGIRHDFEGLLFNRIPLLKKLKWRLFATANVLYGTTSDKNIDLIPQTTLNGDEIPRFSTLGDDPYVEVGYGIENIFRFLKIDFIHRLTYLNYLDYNNSLISSDKFGIKVSAKFRL